MSKRFMSPNFMTIPYNVDELKQFSWKSSFWPCDPYVTSDPSGVRWRKWEVTPVPCTKFGPNRSLYVGDIEFWWFKKNIEPKRHREPKRNMGTSQKAQDGWSLIRRTFLPSLVWIRSTMSELKTFSWKTHFWPLWPLRDLWPRSGHMTCWGWGGGCCDQVWSKSVKNCWSYKHLSMTAVF